MLLIKFCNLVKWVRGLFSLNLGWVKKFEIFGILLNIDRNVLFWGKIFDVGGLL